MVERSEARMALSDPSGDGCLFLMSVVCCQVGVSATGRSLVLRGPTDCDVSVCVI